VFDHFFYLLQKVCQKTGNLLMLNFGPVSREVKTGRMAADMTVFTLNISKLRCELIAEKSFFLKPNNMTLQAFRIEVLTDPCQGG
jgi:hypothetical protein